MLVAQGVIDLESDDEKVAAYLERYGEDAGDISMGLPNGL